MASHTLIKLHQPFPVCKNIHRPARSGCARKLQHRALHTPVHKHWPLWQSQQLLGLPSNGSWAIRAAESGGTEGTHHGGSSHDPDDCQAASNKKFKGICVVSKPSGRCQAVATVQGVQHYLGHFKERTEAAMAYDEALIYQNKEPVNFPGKRYDKARFRGFKTVVDFAEDSRSRARKLMRLGQLSRFVGVQMRMQSNRNLFAAHCNLKGQNKQMCIAYYRTEEEAAEMHDKACIYQDLPYGNFSPSQYVQADICKFADFAEFVKYHRKAAQDLIKAEQHSRFPGVTWSKRHGKWEAYSHEPPGGSHGKWPCQKTSFGFFDNEEEAAKEADRGRVKQGKKVVNFPGSKP